jgi:hypothetical protein
MKGSINTPEQEFTEEQFLEQFAALEESLALIQIQMRRMSEHAKLFGGLARHIRRSACPATLSPDTTSDCADASGVPADLPWARRTVAQKAKGGL